MNFICYVLCAFNELEPYNQTGLLQIMPVFLFMDQEYAVT